MNISKINLNLLVSLDALLTEKNVTRAGKRMFITQAAMSNVLRQLRELFNDDLLVQTGKTMVLTQRAHELHPEIKQLLSQAEKIFNPQSFDPAQSERIFNLGMEEYADFVIMPRLYQYISKNAPGVQLNVKHVPLFGEKPLLESQEIDLAIGLLYQRELQGLSSELLFREKAVCIANANHPLLQKSLTLENYLKAKHVTFLPINEDSPQIVDNILGNMGYKRHIALRVSHIISGLYTVANSDLIATVPEKLALEAQRLLGVRIQACPVPIPEITFVQVWHPWTQLDSGCQWLRQVINSVAKSI